MSAAVYTRAFSRTFGFAETLFGNLKLAVARHVSQVKSCFIMRGSPEIRSTDVMFITLAHSGQMAVMSVFAGADMP